MGAMEGIKVWDHEAMAWREPTEQEAASYRPHRNPAFTVGGVRGECGKFFARPASVPVTDYTGTVLIGDTGIQFEDGRVTFCPVSLTKIAGLLSVIMVSRDAGTMGDLRWMKDR